MAALPPSSSSPATPISASTSEVPGRVCRCWRPPSRKNPAIGGVFCFGTAAEFAAATSNRRILHPRLWMARGRASNENVSWSPLSRCVPTHAKAVRRRPACRDVGDPSGQEALAGRGHHRFTPADRAAPESPIHSRPAPAPGAPSRQAGRPAGRRAAPAPPG